MAINIPVYSPQYPNNSKSVSVDIVSRVPLGAEGDEKYVLYVSTTAYSNNSSSTAIAPIYMYEMRRGWAQGSAVSSPVTTAGGTLTVAIDEGDENAVTLTVASGSYSGATLASSLQSQLQYTAVSGTKAAATNRLSYLNAQVKYEDSKLIFMSGSTRQSFNDADWNKTSSAKVTGGTLQNSLGFADGYPNSYDLATTSSGYLQSPASAHVSIDDAIRFAVMSLVNQMDFTS